MNGGLAVIADLPKTRVYALCRWLNQQGVQGSNGAVAPVVLGALATQASTPGLIPHNILDKPPSAELKPGQVDQDSLPPYDVLDDILDRLVQRHESIADMVAAGHDAAVVEKVLRLVSRAEFKRRQAPPVLKVTDRAFGMGWRMPIANRWRHEAPGASHSLSAEQLLEA
jgi:NAD+ synthase (glutamine-hydrolysing)